jgi:hypothetical protein
VREKKGVAREKKGVVRERKGVVRERKGVVRERKGVVSFPAFRSTSVENADCRDKVIDGLPCERCGMRGTGET